MVKRWITNASADLAVLNRESLGGRPGDAERYAAMTCPPLNRDRLLSGKLRGLVSDGDA